VGYPPRSAHSPWPHDFCEGTIHHKICVYRYVRGMLDKHHTSDLHEYCQSPCRWLYLIVSNLVRRLSFHLSLNLLRLRIQFCVSRRLNTLSVAVPSTAFDTWFVGFFVVLAQDKTIQNKLQVFKTLGLPQKWSVHKSFLVGGLEHVDYDFPIILEMSSSQLTNSLHHFPEG
jgi:hypothetical protein